MEVLDSYVDDRNKFFRRKEGVLDDDAIEYLQNLEQGGPEWKLFRERRFFVGGSDFGNLIGVNKYQKTPKYLEELRATEPGFRGNVYTKFGHLMEDTAGQFALKMLCKLGDLPEAKVSRESLGTCVHRKHPHLAASLDGILWAEDGCPRLKTSQICAFLGNSDGLDLNDVCLEIKCPTTASGQGIEGVPSSYMAQMQLQIDTMKHMRQPHFKRRHYAILAVLCCDVKNIDRFREHVLIGHGSWVLKSWLVEYSPTFLEWAYKRMDDSIMFYEDKGPQPSSLPDSAIPLSVLPRSIRLPDFKAEYNGPVFFDMSVTEKETKDEYARTVDIVASPENFSFPHIGLNDAIKSKYFSE